MGFGQALRFQTVSAPKIRGARRKPSCTAQFAHFEYFLVLGTSKLCIQLSQLTVPRKPITIRSPKRMSAALDPTNACTPVLVFWMTVGLNAGSTVKHGMHVQLPSRALSQ